MDETSSSAPGQPPAPSQTPETSAGQPVVVKKYANRRLYNTETSSYITLENLAEMIHAGRDFVVYDAKSGDDITRGVLTQIIVEEESKGSAMLPTGFLRQLIGFYGGNLQGVVPRYLEYTMASFTKQQQQVRQVIERTFSPFLPTGVEEMSRQNMALFERAISMWNPFLRGGEGKQGAAEGGDQDGEIAWLRQEVESLRHQLAAAHAQAAEPATPPATPPATEHSAAASNPPANVVRDAPESGGGKPQRRQTRGRAVEPASGVDPSLPDERRESEHRDPSDAQHTIAER